MMMMMVIKYHSMEKQKRRMAQDSDCEEEHGKRERKPPVGALLEKDENKVVAQRSGEFVKHFCIDLSRAR